MGLVLTSSESLDSDLALSFLTEHRHLQGRPSFNPQAKHPRRPFHWSHSKSTTRHGVVAEPLNRPLWGDPLPHHLTLYNSNLARHRTPRYVDPFTSDISQSRRTHLVSSRKSTKFDSAEGIALARCEDVRLPGEKRPPSLERQDAFRDGSTCKRKREGLRSLQRGDSQDEELYRLGILYDDEYTRGEGFSFASIAREAPVWNGEEEEGEVKESDGAEKGGPMVRGFASLQDDSLAVVDDGSETVEERVQRIKRKVADLTTSGPPADITSHQAGPVVEEETIEQRVQRIKRRIAELTSFDPPPEDAPSVIPERADEETAEQRVARIKGELWELRQQNVDGQEASMPTAALGGGDFQRTTVEPSEQDFTQLVARFEKLKRYPARKVQDNDDDDDVSGDDGWAVLDAILEGSGRDAANIASVDADVDDTWIMLGSDGS
ncbi:hypothetical protein QBC34DRAFT_493529 [Podospora aff. communis PSN243]|uniref:Uncharacterized protein n=1 Tax=Podospora aff. communis PSN243 TaxID=3040156 RepID=A0AAV9GWX8_9PEZI|nr:hypothetical protein QBC34DRAFT_493529 [Podospora aff. communis PSN243]